MSARPAAPGALGPRRSFATRVSLAAFGLTAAFALAVGLASWAVADRVLGDRLLDDLRLEASLHARELEQPLRELSHGLESLAGSSFLTNALVDSMGRERYVVPFLREVRLASAVPVRIALCDHLGREVAANTPGDGRSFAGAPWLARALARRETVAILAEGRGSPVQLATPVILEHTGQAEGLLVAELDLGELFARAHGPQETGAVRRLLDGRGSPLASDLGAPEDALAVRWPLEGGAAGALGLQLEMRVPRERALAPLRQLALAYAVAGVLLAVAALLAARELASTLTRPLRTLHAAAAEAAARASFAVRVPVTGTDEVAELGAAFNEMLARLDASAAARCADEEVRRTRAEGALELAHAALEQASEVIEILRPDGTVLYANGASAELHATTREAMVGKAIWRIAPERIPEERWRQTWAEVCQRGSHEERFELHRGGATAVFEVRLHHLSFAGAEYCLATARDASDRVRAEQAGRLASLGTLAAGVAHEINNPLAYLSANLGWVRRELGAKGLPVSVDAVAADDLREALLEASQGAVRVQEVVRSLRVFARPAAPRRVSNDVEEELRSAIQLTANEVRHRARLVVEIAPLPPVLAGEHELGQVFTNLLVNAAQAVAPGKADENLIRVTARTIPPAQVVVEVSDTGCGIPRDRLARIFEPFFTTKPAGAGTGLGLSVCDGIVTRAGGRIDVESQEGRGSTFRVTLPADLEARATAAPPAGPQPDRRLRVLIVDDEAAIGRAVARALGRQHDLVETTSPRQALAFLSDGRAFDVLLCDLMMPEMTGMELHQRVAERDPGLAARTVVITGGAFTPEARAFLATSALPVLEKPFATEALLAALARAAAQASPGGQGGSKSG